MISNQAQHSTPVMLSGTKWSRSISRHVALLGEMLRQAQHDKELGLSNDYIFWLR